MKKREVVHVITLLVMLVGFFVVSSVVFRENFTITGNFVKGGSTYTCYNCSDCEAAIANASVGEVIQLGNDINDSDGTCIDFGGADNIVLDCQNFLVNSSSGNKYAFYSSPSVDNVTIQNCDVSGVMVFYSSFNVTLDNINTDGQMTFVSDSYSTIKNVVTDAYSTYSFYLTTYYSSFDNISYLGSNKSLGVFRINSGSNYNNFTDINDFSFYDISSQYNNFDNSSFYDLDLDGATYSSFSNVNISDGDGLNLHTVASFNVFDGMVIDGTTSGVLLSSDDNVFDNVRVVNSGYGVKFGSGVDNNTFDSCNFSGNDENVYLYAVSLTSKNEMYPSNIIDYDKKIYYNNSASDFVFDSSSAPDAGMVVCINCSNVVYRDMVLAGDYSPFILAYVNDSVVENVTANGNSYSGIRVIGENDNISFVNVTANNNYRGMYVEFTENSSFDNLVVSNSYGDYGIRTYYVDNSNFSNIIVENNSGSGFEASYTTYSSFENITAVGSSVTGFLIGANSDYNNLTNSTITNSGRENIYLYYGDYNILDGVVLNDSNMSSGTFHLSQLGEDGEFVNKYSDHLGVNYEEREYGFEKIDGKVTLRVSQKNYPFADLDMLSLDSCFGRVEPEYAVYTDTNESVLEYIMYSDLDVITMTDREIEVSWDIPWYCFSNEQTVRLFANEYGFSREFRYPETEGEYTSYDFDNSGSFMIDGNISDLENIDADYLIDWIPLTGHPNGTTYVYVRDDEGFVYFAFDILLDNSDDYGYDWLAVDVVDEDGVEGEFLVDDFMDEFGVCSFGRTNKVSYRHEICEMRIPKGEFENGINFSVKYYGTGGGFTPVYGTGILFYSSNYNVLKNSDLEDNLETGLYFYSSSYNSVFNNIFNNDVNFKFYSSGSANEFNTSLSASSNIVNGSNIGGNCWANYSDVGFSENCTDGDLDDICDSSYSVGSFVDSLPLVCNITVEGAVSCTPNYFEGDWGSYNDTHDRKTFTADPSALDCSTTYYEYDLICNWTCSSWSTCSSSVQSRNCSLEASCTRSSSDQEDTRPDESQSCVSSDDSGSSGSSGGGGGGSGSTLNAATGITEVINDTIGNVFSEMNIGEPTNIVINDSTFGLTDVSISVSENLTNTAVVIEEIENVSEANLKLGIDLGKTLEVFEAFSVEKINFSNDQVAEVILNFKISRDWMEKKMNETSFRESKIVKSIDMFKRENESDSWSSVSTSFIGSDEDYYYFKAVSDGFSVFVYGFNDGGDLDSLTVEDIFVDYTFIAMGVILIIAIMILIVLVIVYKRRYINKKLKKKISVKKVGK